MPQIVWVVLLEMLEFITQFMREAAEMRLNKYSQHLRDSTCL